MPITIKAERIHGVNGDAWKLVEVKMLEAEALPDEYKAGSPRVYLQKPWIFAYGGRGTETYSVGDTLTPAEFDSLLATCRAAGERLSEIHRRIWSPSWTGVETFTI